MLRVVASLALPFMLTVTPVAVGGDGCIADWSVAANIVRGKGLATVETLSQRAKTKLVGSIVQTMLCQSRSGYHYRMVVRAPDGRLHTVIVDAANPFE